MARNDLIYIYNKNTRGVFSKCAAKGDIIGAIHEIRRNKIYRALRFNPLTKGIDIEGEFGSFSSAYDWINQGITEDCYGNKL